ncbi:MAG: PEP-CTERM sorting domain-containing protein [Bryobacterales bacterium]|nr:PEP-CTERM sorting domain-containing protein [Bryobacterales bacterium]
MLASPEAFGAVVACPTSSPGAPIRSVNSAGNGCAEIDKSFTNISITNMSGAGAPDATGIYMFATGTPPIGNTISPVGVTFDTPGPGATWNVTGGASIAETINYQVNANTGGSYPTPATPGLVWAINQIALTPSVNIQNFFGGTNDNATITLAFCLNATSCTGTATGTIVASYSGTNTAVYSCSYSGCVSGTSNTVNLTGSVTQIAIAESLTINSSPVSPLNSVTINSIQNQFGEVAALGPVPEPATFVLIGAGLLGIALRKLRAPG